MAFRVLVVDDASFVRDTIKRNLRTLIPDMEVHEAADGRAACTGPGHRPTREGRARPATCPQPASAWADDGSCKGQREQGADSADRECEPEFLENVK